MWFYTCLLILVCICICVNCSYLFVWGWFVLLCCFGDCLVDFCWIMITWWFWWFICVVLLFGCCRFVWLFVITLCWVVWLFVNFRVFVAYWFYLFLGLCFIAWIVSCDFGCVLICCVCDWFRLFMVVASCCLLCLLWCASGWVFELLFYVGGCELRWFWFGLVFDFVAAGLWGRC